MLPSDQFDPAGVERLRKLGGDQFTMEMIGLFLDFAHRKLDEAKEARSSGDLRKIGDAAHAIKSSAANVGAVRMQDLCLQIEHLAVQQQVEVVGPLVDDLEAALALVKPLLEEIRESLAKVAG